MPKFIRTYLAILRNLFYIFLLDYLSTYFILKSFFNFKVFEDKNILLLLNKLSLSFASLQLFDSNNINEVCGT